MISLKSAQNFHGHLGPWLVLGLLIGEFGLNKIKAKKYFGIDIKVSGLHKKPRSCLIDGLQLSTGATLGKGNIHLNGAKKIAITFVNCENQKKVSVGIQEELLKKLNREMNHKEAEAMARKLFKTSSPKIVQILG